MTQQQNPRNGLLAGKVALVTGAGRGIARRFAAEGARVAVVSRTAANVETVVAEIQAGGGQAYGVSCDVAVRQEVFDCVRKVAEHYGTVDVLINNAHATEDLQHNFEDTTDEQLMFQLQTGYFGTVHFMQAAFPYLKRRGGKIVNFASGAGLNGAPKYLAYAGAKEAVRAATRVAAREWGAHKINVNVVCPIAITGALEEAIKDPRTAAAAAATALGRFGTVDDDVVPAVLFLATDASQYMTGHSFMVDGGNSIDAGR